MRTLLVPIALFVSSTALAQTTPPSTTAAPTATTSQAGTTPTDERARISREAGLAVREAIDSLRVGNVTNALTALDRANTIEPGRADVPYFVGVVRRREDRLDDALASFRASIDAAARTSDADMGVRARVGAADTLERLGRLEEARSAWVAVVEYVGAHPSPLYGQMGDVARERAGILVARLESDQRYAEVKARIAAREAAQQPARRSSHTTPHP